MSRIFRLLLGTTVALALGACASGSKPPEPTPLGPVASILKARTAWSAHIGPVPATFTAAVVQDGTSQGVVVASKDGTVLRIDANTGREVWRSHVQGGISAAAGSDGNFTAVVNDRNQVVSLGPQGQVLWLYQLPTSVITPPAVVAGAIVVQGADQRLWAFNAATGQTLWTNDSSRAPALLLQQASGIVPYGDGVLVGNALGRIDDVAMATGFLRWEATLARPRGITEVERIIDIAGAPSVAGSTVCARAYQSAIGCVDAGTGRVLWTVKANGATGISQNGSTVVATQGDGVVQAYAAADGAAGWSNDQLKYRKLTAPVLLGMTVAVGDYQGYISFLSAKDGSIVGRVSTDGSAIRSPLVAVGNTLIAITHTGGVFGFVPE